MEAGAPNLYHRLLGKVLFDPYAREFAKRLPPIRRGPVLEVACGTGILTRRLVQRFPCGFRFIASDIRPDMLSEFHFDSVDSMLADMTALPFRSGTFHEVLCQFGLMFLRKPESGLREIRRVLAGRGVLTALTWASVEENPWARTVHEATLRTFPNADLPSLDRPFRMGDMATLRETFTQAGFVSIHTEKLKLPVVVQDPQDFALGLVRGNPLGAALMERGFTDLDRLVKEIADRLHSGFGATGRSEMSAILSVVS